ncbi:MAG: flavodoxin [Faecousia sp.]
MNKVIKPIIIALIIAVLIAVWRGFLPNLFAESASPSEVSKGTTSISGDSSILVAYFSLTGNRNYQSDVDAVSSASLTRYNGMIAGNAEVLALTAQETTGGDIFFIEVSDKYPESFDGTSERSSSEQAENARPELASHIEDISPYDTVILIYPDWWGSLPQAVLTFLEEYDFSGKTIIPIATSQGSGLGSGPRQITTACPNATVEDGLSANDVSTVAKFLKDAGLKQE